MAGNPHGLTQLDKLMKVCVDSEGPNADIAPGGNLFPQVFGRMLPENALQLKNLSHKDLVATYDTLVEKMRAADNEDGPAEAGMTFLGQFVDHDITLDATSMLGERIDPRSIRNVRTPNLDLDCVYGSGPDGSPHLYGKDRRDPEGNVIAAEDTKDLLLFGREDNPRDLARTCVGTALIGDPRNDENIIVSQIQGAFITLHNILMSKAKTGSSTARDIHDCAVMGTDKATWDIYVPDKLKDFEEVRRFIRLHYQYVVWNELLPAFVDQACLDEVLDKDPFPKAPAMPVEFSGAGYRFGHATTQNTYALNGTHTDVGLFDMRGFEPRAPNTDLEFGRFFDIDGSRPQRARPVGPRMAEPLFDLPFVHGPMKLPGANYEMSEEQGRKLALRNIIRDRYTYALYDGQRAALLMQLEPLPVHPILKDKGITKTPLWFYCLEEGEKIGHGKLAGVGGLMVASVFARLLKGDPTSVFHVDGFQPWSGFDGHGSVFAGMLKYVEDNRDQVLNAEKLRCG